MYIIKWTTLLFLILLGLYTVYCSKTESIISSGKKIFQFKWGRQVVADLYIGLFLFSFLIYLNEDSAWIALAWITSSLILGNLVPLLYLFVNFNEIVSRFTDSI